MIKKGLEMRKIRDKKQLYPSLFITFVGEKYDAF